MQTISTYLGNTCHQLSSRCNSIVTSRCNSIVTYGYQKKDQFTNYFKTISNDFQKTNLWKKCGKPLYQRNIEPLQKADYFTLGGGFILANTVFWGALKVWGIAILAFACGVAGVLFCGALAFLKYRLNCHFDQEACKHIKKIRKAAKNTTYLNQNFAEIAQYKKELQRPEFNHREQDFQELNKELERFRIAVINDDPHYTTQPSPSLKDSQEAFIIYLKGLQNKLDSDSSG